MLGKEVYTIDIFTSYENRDEVRIKTCIEIKYKSEGTVTRVALISLNIITTICPNIFKHNFPFNFTNTKF